MATNLLSERSSRPDDESRTWTTSQSSPLARVIRPLASLRLTVALFAMSIFIVLAGTVAQIDKDVWEVIHTYFRSPTLVWIDFRIFFPREWKIYGGIYFPSLWLIGVALAVNLLAAHAVRFKIQAKGSRLASGLVVIATGVGLLWLAVVGLGQIDPQWLWLGMKVGLAGLFVGTVVGLARVVPGRALEFGLLLSAAIIEGGLLGWLLFRGSFTLDPSSMRILWQLIQGGAIGLVLLGGCTLVFKRRAGIVLIHAGVGLMMFNELYVGLTSVEGQMTMTAGEIHNYVEDIRTVELAVVDPSAAKEDEVVVVPKSLLLTGGVIHDENLPVDVEVVRFLQNATIQSVEPGQSNPATAGLGKTQAAVERPAGTGTDTDSKVDISAVYVQLLNKQNGKPLGTYLLSVALNPETVTIDGKPYELSLRFKRNYKPYSIQLLKAESQLYPGTSKPRTYSSDVHLVDPTTHTDRDKVHISMNNPLRYGGETFYQSGFVPGKAGAEITTLSVVTNQGWMIPYLGCMIVATGLLAHFFGVLVRFLRRQESVVATQYATGTSHWSDSQSPLGARASAAPAHAVQPELPQRSNWKHLAGEFFPWIAVAILAGWAGSKAIPPRTDPDAMNLYEFGKLPVEFEGRVKPLDTLARNSLWAVSDRQTFTDSKGQRRPAIQWLLDVIADPDGAAGKDRVIRIRDPEVLSLLGLDAASKKREADAAKASKDATDKNEAAEKKPGEDEEHPDVYSLDEIRTHWDEFSKQSELAHAAAEGKGTPSPFQQQILDLDRRLNTLAMLRFSFNPLLLSQLPSDEELKKDPQGAKMAAAEIRDRIDRLREVTLPLPLAVPVESADERWQPYSLASDLAHVGKFIPGDKPNPRTITLGKIFAAYKEKDAAIFNLEVNRYRAELAESPPPPLDIGKTDLEALFNHAEPFFYLMILYVVVFALACAGLATWQLGWSAPFNRAAFWLVVVTLTMHTLAEVARITIAGRPPITNLYSAALFVGWGSVLLGLLLEIVFPVGIGNLVAGTAGFVTLLIAHFLASSGGDTVTVMEPVLDTQFWLATHVTCVSSGYFATFVAGLLGLFYILLGVFTPLLSVPAGQSRSASPLTFGKILATMIYGVVCFAILFSFVGTVLGGLWADNSWGRFWGWDPKENGALIIVIWNALVLHARWGGMVKERGLAVLAVGGIIAVAWSGFGVNELGVGLHAYGGSTAKTVITLLAVGGSQLAIIAIGALLPKRYWASFRTPQPPMAEIVG